MVVIDQLCFILTSYHLCMADTGLKTPGRLQGTAGAAAQTPFTGGSNKSRLSIMSNEAGKTPGPGGSRTPGAYTLATPAPVSVHKATPRTNTRSTAEGDVKTETVRADQNENMVRGGCAVAPALITDRTSKLLQKQPSPSAVTNVMLPSPFREQPPKQWNIPEDVVHGRRGKSRTTAASR